MVSVEKSRALRILIAYLDTNLGFAVKKLGPAVMRGSGETAKINYALLKKKTAFPEGTFEQLRVAVAEALVRPENRAQLSQDYVWVWPLLAELGIDQDVRPGEVDETPVDLEFLRALGLPHRTEDHDQLYERIGGFWYIIRLSTENMVDNRPSYNVSLLTVKPRAYTATSDGTTYEDIKSHLLHFSLRSRFTDRLSNVQVHRGRIVEVNGTISFLGDRRVGSVKKIFLMTWHSPSVTEERRRIRHADIAQGAIVTGNSSDVIVAGPVAACHIRGVKDVEIPQRDIERREKDDDWRKRRSDTYKEMGDKAGKHVRAYTDDELKAAFQDVHLAVPIGEVVAALERSLAETRKSGYTRVANT